MGDEDTQSQRDSILQKFQSVTQCDDIDEALKCLENSNWVLDDAINYLYRDKDELEGEQELEEAYRELESPQPGLVPPGAGRSVGPFPRSVGGSGFKPSSSSPSNKSKAKTGRIASLSDFRQGSPGADEESDDAGQDWFSGGEKSSLAVENPDNDRNRLVKNILRQAEIGGQHYPELAGGESSAPATRQQRSQFTGTGFVLGGENSEPTTESDNTVGKTPEEEEETGPVTRSLTFWRNGFTVEDGPLRRYDDPLNQEILRSINQGRAPLSLLNVRPGQPVDVRVSRKLEEDFKEPPAPRKPFEGSGTRLGSTVPGERVESPVPTTESSSVSEGKKVDTSADKEGEGDALVQIRLADGTRIRHRFQSGGPVEQLYEFVEENHPPSRGYILQTTFPNKELLDRKQNLTDAKVVGAVVVQKWI